MVATSRIFKQFDWAPRNQNCKTDMEPHIKYSNFYVKPRLPMTNEGVLDRFRAFRPVKLQPIWSYRCKRRLISQNEHWKNEATSNLPIFGNFGSPLCWDNCTSVSLQDKNSVATDSGRPLLLYHCRPFPACVSEVFNHLSIRTSFLRTY